MKRKEREYLLSILDAIEEIRHHQKNHDPRTAERAIIYELIKIGEAVNRLSKDIQSKYDNIPWAEIVAFRNILIHQYLDVEMDSVRFVVDNDLDELKNTVKKILDEME